MLVYSSVGRPCGLRLPVVSNGRAPPGGQRWPRESPVGQKLVGYAVAPDATEQNVSLKQQDDLPVTSKKIVLESEEELKSTWEHRAWVGGSTLLMTATFFNGLSHADGLVDYFSLGFGTAMAYLLADLGTGIYHWGVDNYGDGNTPVFGGQIAAFQGHHQRPWTITEREFCNNVHKVFAPATPVAGVMWIGSCLHPGTWSVVASTFLFLACMSQQFHAWSHMKKSELPLLVDMAQEAGLLISRKDHGAHHKAPFDGNYCIVSGIWNPILDQGGDEKSVFRALENFIFAVWSVEPRCWHPPDSQWCELEKP